MHYCTELSIGHLYNWLHRSTSCALEHQVVWKIDCSTDSLQFSDTVKWCLFLIKLAVQFVTSSTLLMCAWEVSSKKERAL